MFLSVLIIILLTLSGLCSFMLEVLEVKTVLVKVDQLVVQEYIRTLTQVLGIL